MVTTTTELDREVMSEHQLAIQVCTLTCLSNIDSIDPANIAMQASDGSFVSDPITITVAVSDLNDNSPYFTEDVSDTNAYFSGDVYSVTVVENRPAGRHLSP